jgi:hypothetical protein
MSPSELSKQRQAAADVPVAGGVRADSGGFLMRDKQKLIGAILVVMREFWDLPSDCNDGELFTYAEVLCDRILEGGERDDLYAYLGDVQTGKLEMPPSTAYRSIVDRSLELAETSA